jgi:hypothetical protein
LNLERLTEALDLLRDAQPIRDHAEWQRRYLALMKPPTVDPCEVCCGEGYRCAECGQPDGMGDCGGMCMLVPCGQCDTTGEVPRG